MAVGGWRIIWDRRAYVPALHRTIIREKLPVIMPFLFKYAELSKEDSERDIETVHRIWLPSDDRAEDEMFSVEVYYEYVSEEYYVFTIRSESRDSELGYLIFDRIPCGTLLLEEDEEEDR